MCLCPTIDSESKAQRLHIYALLAIMDNLDLGDLMSVADTSEQFREFIINHYAIGKYRLHEKQIRIRGHCPLKEKYIESDSNTSIDIYDWPFALKLLRQFGMLITNLEFDAKKFNHTKRIILNQHITKYCSQTLLDIKLKAIFGVSGNMNFYRCHSKMFRMLAFITVYLTGKCVLSTKYSRKCKDLNYNLLHSLMQRVLRIIFRIWNTWH